ncbi:hypothetical protein V8B97DRAFT_276039 [Scleroderma yunnanense]
MDNPWANAWEPPLPVHEQEADIGIPSWSTTHWSSSTDADDGSLWKPSAIEELAWAPSTYEQIVISRSSSTTDPTTTPLDDVHEPALLAPPPQDTKYGTPTDHSALPFQEDSTIIPDADVSGGTASLSSPKEDDEPDAWEDPTILTGPDDEWSSAWNTAEEQAEAKPPDEWETAQQEKEKLNRAVAPELLASILSQCQEVLDEIWPESEAVESNASDNSWRTGLHGLEKITKLLNELIPDDVVLPPPVHYPTTATAKAMNEALKLTRHSTLTGSSPLAKLLASKGSLDWQRSVVSREDVVPDAAPVGWRILDKEEHRTTAEETKPKRGGLLSFWNRRTSSLTPEEVRETSPSRRTSIGNGANSATSPQTQAKRDTSPANRSSASTPPSQPAHPTSPEVTVAAAAPAPSAVSRFLNRFSRTKGAGSHRSSLALSVDDLEYLSDIVPSASDPDNEQVSDGSKALSNMITSSLPTKLPPPLPPSPKPPVTSPSTFDGKLLESAELPRTPQQLGLPSSLPLPLSPKPISSLTRSLSPILPPKDSNSRLPNPSIVIPASRSAVSTILKLSSPQPPSRSQSPFTLPPPPKASIPLSLPPLLPPPPISPPQTPRPTAMQPLSPPPSSFTPSSSSYMWSNSISGGHDDDASDEEFFSSFSSRSPYRPSHVSSDSASVHSPESQNSGDQLRSARSSISQSFDDFDEFVSSPSHKLATPRSPSPPPLPAKNTPPSRYRMASHTTRHSVDHQRTQSLMDMASTTKGTWPSPIGNGLPVRPIPPPSAPQDLLGFDDPPIPSALTLPPQPLLAELGSSMHPGTRSVPAISPFYPPLAVGRTHQLSKSPPPLPATPSQPLLSFSSAAFMTSPSPLSVKPLPQTQTTPKRPHMSGLSAQDLSFFEGL